MKKRIAALLIAIGIAGVGIAVQAQDSQKDSPNAVAQTSEPIIRGEALGGSPAATLTDVIKDPKSFTGKRVIIEGVIARVCSKKGCWMELTPKAGETGLRVTFKNYGFFVPTDSQGMKVKAEGEVSIKVLTKAQADHLSEEGANLKRNDDGTVDEAGFIAVGVELRK